jgi:uncharacterized membrane protein YkvA (DUF1232 family)
MNKNKKTKGVSKEFIRKGASKIKKEDVKKVLDKAKEIEKKFESNGPLQRFIEDFKLLLSVVSDYWNGRYREIPWWTISAIVFVLLYVLSPIDLIPDFIPGIGYIDDAAVVSLAIILIEKELQKYKVWKVQNA